jgi:hypothetical protein
MMIRRWPFRKVVAEKMNDPLRRHHRRSGCYPFFQQISCRTRKRKASIPFPRGRTWNVDGLIHDCDKKAKEKLEKFDRFDIYLHLKNRIAWKERRQWNMSLRNNWIGNYQMSYVPYSIQPVVGLDW